MHGTMQGVSGILFLFLVVHALSVKHLLFFFYTSDINVINVVILSNSITLCFCQIVTSTHSLSFLVPPLAEG